MLDARNRLSLFVILLDTEWLFLPTLLTTTRVATKRDGAVMRRVAMKRDWRGDEKSNNEKRRSGDKKSSNEKR